MQLRTRNLLAASGMLSLSSLLWFNYSAVLPLIVSDWGLSGLRASIIYSAFQAGYILLVIPIGMLSDRYDARKIAAIGATAAALASLCFPIFAQGYMMGTFLRFIAGIGMAGVFVPGMHFVSNSYQTNRGRAIGIYVGTYSISSGVTFVVSSWLGSMHGWEFALGVTSLVALTAGPVILLVGQAPPGGDSRTGKISFDVLRNPTYLLTVGIYSAHSWELFGVRNWITAFLVSTATIAATDNPAATAGLLAGVMAVMGGFGNLLGGTLSDRFNRQSVIAVGLLASALCSLAIGFIGWLPMGLLLAFLLIYGVVITVDSAPTSTMVTEVVDSHQTGSALSIQSFIGTIPGTIAPVVFGAVLDSTGYELAFQTLGIGALAGVGIVLLFPMSDFSDRQNMDSFEV